MSKKYIWIGLLAVSVIIAGALVQTIPPEAYIKTVNMVNNKGESMGTVRISETRAGVLLDLDLAGLTANGEHAIHIHEKGDCSPLETFKNAGGHYNPTEKAHGKKHPDGHHAGDMPNLKPNDKGEIKTAFVNTNVTLSKDGEASVYDEDGSAIVIHAGADDHMSQPSGAAGDRIACGVIGN